MAENRGICGQAGGQGRETVCIDTYRVLDSSRDRDCYEDVRVYLTPFGQEIVNGTLHRGVTILEGRGAYSGNHRDVLMCVVKRPQIGELKRAIKSIDERAFFIVTNAKNVFGNGFENISEVR